eukprot:Clim_evm8s61 gene=Clim_evmTU8s61
MVTKRDKKTFVTCSVLRHRRVWISSMTEIPDIYVYDSQQALSVNLATYVSTVAKAAIHKRGRAIIGLSGGSLPGILARGLQSESCPTAKEVDWSSKVHFIFCDERYVPLDHSDSNFHLCKKEIFGPLGVPDSNVLAMNPNLSLGEAASDYERRLRALLGTASQDDLQETLELAPEYLNRQPKPENLSPADLLLLGMGPDGHTCSIFPGSNLGNPKALEAVAGENGGQSCLVAPVFDSPKPPPERITLTITFLNTYTRRITFVTAGEGKAPMVRRLLEPFKNEVEVLPCQLVRPMGKGARWAIDSGAAKDLTRLTKL